MVQMTWSTDQFVLKGEGYGFAPIVYTELAEDTADMKTGGRTTDCQAFGDLGIGQAFNH